MPGNLTTLSPICELNSFGLPARLFERKVKARDHQTVLQKAKLHVLAALGRTGVVGLLVGFKFVLHARMNLWKSAVIGKHFECLLLVKVVDEFAVASKAWKGEPVHDLPLPEHPEASVGKVFVAAD